MIEIYAIYKFCKLFGQMLRAKHRNPILFQVLFVLLWFLGEFSGAIVFILFFSSQSSSPGAAYLGALVGAAGATALMYSIIKQIPTKSPDRQFISPPPLPVGSDQK